MSEDVSDEVSARAWLGPTRLGIGLAQGLVLFALNKSAEVKVWPGTDHALLGALIALFALAPLILLSGVAALRRKTLVVWSAVAGPFVLGLAYYANWRQPFPWMPYQSSTLIGEDAFAIAIAVFIGHHLVAAGDRERRWVASYPAYYDAAWKSTVQLVLSGLFLGVFWGLLWLGAALFKLIGISSFQDIIQKDWFAFPATGVVFAAAVHLTDARASLTRGVRTILLALLSWLMPLMAAIAAAFLIALPFTGLGPLWQTHAASNVLLSAAAAMVVLLNATYHDGTPERRPIVVLRWAGRLAAVLIAPLVLIAIYGVVLRVQQYGWSPQRIVALACAVVGACYGIGYLFAAVLPGPWLRPLERTNIVTAVIVIGVILALFSPIADPARISVADQVARLDSGKTPADRFDFASLKFQGARFGRDALKALEARKTGPGAALIASAAATAEKQEFPFNVQLPPRQLAARITVYPKGKALPRSFVDQRWDNPDNEYVLGPCVARAQDCDGFLIDLDGDGIDEVVLANADTLWVYQVGPAGLWQPVGHLLGIDAKLRDAMRAGSVAPVPARWKDLKVGQQRLRFSPSDLPSNVRLQPLSVFTK